MSLLRGSNKASFDGSSDVEQQRVNQGGGRRDGAPCRLWRRIRSRWVQPGSFPRTPVCVRPCGASASGPHGSTCQKTRRTGWGCWAPRTSPHRTSWRRLLENRGTRNVGCRAQTLVQSMQNHKQDAMYTKQNKSHKRRTCLKKVILIN